MTASTRGSTLLSMQFKPPPKISNRAIDRAGVTLIDATATKEALNEARDVLNEWRACHGYCINTFQSTLRSKVRKGSFGEGVIIAQRLKRAPTIINKLREGKDYDVTLLTMQDIAGVRAIVPSIEDVRKLEKEYRDSKRFEHILHRSKDYIQKPKPSDGYRSVHLVYKYRNKKHPKWDNLLIELQIRTPLQHSWANAVETIQAIEKKAIKTRRGQQGDQKWKEFFSLVSTVFAILEEAPIADAHLKMSHEDILQRIRTLQDELKVMDKLKAYPQAFELMNQQQKGTHFHLITLNTIDHVISVQSFRRQDFEEANKSYEEAEKEFAETPEVESVLVSATEIKEAFPSFFVDTKDFRENLVIALSGRWVKTAVQ